MDQHQMHYGKNEMLFEHKFSNEILHTDELELISNLPYKKKYSSYKKEEFIFERYLTVENLDIQFVENLVKELVVVDDDVCQAHN